MDVVARWCCRHVSSGLTVWASADCVDASRSGLPRVTAEPAPCFLRLPSSPPRVFLLSCLISIECKRFSKYCQGSVRFGSWW
ncbi:hypothetical protein BOO71_0005893 [Deinococcus marmoris]|uniref:Uncharacterized protein n=1 Tax=Deinococcus marmoris TaxID=249408 RepID=A0A1U7NZC3_9DEIO|nr:hypothetical protein BOO71_0005893 [Deinococcus marmoris]